MYGQNLGFQNNYNVGAGTDFGTYNNINQGYGSVLGGLENGQIGVGIGSTLPQQQQGQSQGQGGPSFNNMGGGWDQSSPGTPQGALQQAFAQGLSGQQAVDAANSSLGLQPPNSISASPDGSYGLPNGFYVAPNAQNGGQLDLISRGGSGGSSGGLNGALGGALSGYSDFASTGGLSPQDQQSLRDQSEAATRGVFQTAQSNLNQNRQLQQFSPNYAAATTNLARNMGYGVSQADIGTNSAIAQMVQQGKLSGLQGMTGIGSINNQAQAANINAELGALGGNTSLYGSAPGMGSTYGNQLNQSGGNLLGAQQSQNQIGGQLINGQLGESNVPGDFQQGVGNVTSLLSPVAGFLSPFGFGASSGGYGVAGNSMANPYGGG